MTEKGVFSNGIPYVRFGEGEKAVLVFYGGPGNDPPSGLMLRMFTGAFKSLSQNHVVYIVTRKFGLPEGYTTRDMSEDYAVMIRDEFNGGPIDVVGVSFGGFIAQHLAADHPSLIRRLVIAMAAYKGREESLQLDMKYAELMSQGKTREASTTMLATIPAGIKKSFYKFIIWLFTPIILSKPTSPNDLLVEAKAACEHDSKNRLAKINVPTLVIAGDKDFYFPAELFRETAAAIPNAKLILYEGIGHEKVLGKQFDEDVLKFLSDNEGEGP